MVGLGRVPVLASILMLAACSGGDPQARSDQSDLTEGDESKGDEAGCAADGECAGGEYCAFNDGVCGTGERGICKAASSECPASEFPVCGCDGVTYFNGCEAGRFAISVAYEGACAAAPPSQQQVPPAAGCAAKSDCSGGEYCDFSDGTCGEQGAAGSCTVIGGPCTGKFEPVCGCNGKTYDTKCEALIAGVSIRYVGACN